MAENNFELKVDKDNRCIDRSTPEGKMLDELQSQADKASGGMGKFMNNVLAFTEVSFVVQETMSKEDAADTMKHLHDEFESVVRG